MEVQHSLKRISRRDMLKITWSALGALATVELGGISLAYLQPPQIEGSFGGKVTAGLVDDLPPDSVTQIPEGRFYLSRLPDGGFLALYQRCTHLGCSVPWDQVQRQFICPCHSSQFTNSGEVLNAPAPRPLDVFPVTIEDGIVQVDTSRPITRQTFDPSQVVYP